LSKDVLPRSSAGSSEAGWQLAGPGRCEVDASAGPIPCPGTRYERVALAGEGYLVVEPEIGSSVGRLRADQRQPRAGATWVRMLSRTWAL